MLKLFLMVLEYADCTRLYCICFVSKVIIDCKILFIFFSPKAWIVACQPRKPRTPAVSLSVLHSLHAFVGLSKSAGYANHKVIKKCLRLVFNFIYAFYNFYIILFGHNSSKFCSNSARKCEILPAEFI